MTNVLFFLPIFYLCSLILGYFSSPEDSVLVQQLLSTTRQRGIQGNQNDPNMINMEFNKCYRKLPLIILKKKKTRGLSGW